MCKEEFCELMYNTNDEFKAYIDRCANDSYPERTVANLMSYETIYEIAKYYHDKAKEIEQPDICANFIQEEKYSEDKAC